MKIIIEKKKYISPVVEKIEFDNCISMQLESEPPTGPFEGYNIYNNQNEPFLNNISDNA